jgi:hypothetical protein
MGVGLPCIVAHTTTFLEGDMQKGDHVSERHGPETAFHDRSFDLYQCRTLNIVDVILALHRIVFDGPSRTDLTRRILVVAVLCFAVLCNLSNQGVLCLRAAETPQHCHRD